MCYTKQNLKNQIIFNVKKSDAVGKFLKFYRACSKVSYLKSTIDRTRSILTSLILKLGKDRLLAMVLIFKLHHCRLHKNFQKIYQFLKQNTIVLLYIFTSCHDRTNNVLFSQIRTFFLLSLKEFKNAYFREKVLPTLKLQEKIK